MNTDERATTRLACPLCKTYTRSAYDLVGFADNGGSDGPYPLLRCRTCGVEFADRLPGPMDRSALESALDDYYGKADEDRRGRCAAFMDRVQRVAPKAGGLHDVGCGNGQLLLEAAGRGWAVQGNDLVESPRVALQAHGVRYFRGSLADLGLPSNQVDVVTSYCVLPNHPAEPLAEMRAVYDLLRPGGWFVAELPDDGIYRKSARLLYHLSLRRWTWILSRICSPAGHQFAYNRRSIKLMLRRLGYGQICIEPFDQHPYWSLRQFAASSVARRSIAAVAVYSLSHLSRLFGQPNHMLVTARKPLAAGSDTPPTGE